MYLHQIEISVLFSDKIGDLNAAPPVYDSFFFEKRFNQVESAESQQHF